MDDRPLLEPDGLGDDLPDESHARLKAELVPGERLLWAGRPRPQPVRFGCGYGVACLSTITLLVLGGFSLALALHVIGLRVPPPDNSFTAGLVMCGLGVLVGLATVASWFSQRKQREQAVHHLYALTDRRAIIWRPKFGSDGVEVFTYPRGVFGSLHRIEYPDGTGDVIFFRPRPEDDLSYIRPTGFERVAEVRRVEELIRRFLVGPEPGAEA
jgi:hypothetical protein